MDRETDLMRKISFMIPNAWGQYLYQILFPIKDLVDGTWDVGCDVDEPYLQAWYNMNGEMVDLFASGFFLITRVTCVLYRIR